MDFDAIAQRLYGGPQPAVAAPASSESTLEPGITDADPPDQATRSEEGADEGEQEAEKAPADNVPAGERPLGSHEPVAELRRGEERSLYSRTTPYESISFDSLLPYEHMSQEVKQRARAEFRNIAADIGASPGEAEEFAAKTAAFLKSPPSPEAREQMRKQALREVEGQYGKDARSMLALARRLIERDPLMKASMDRSGIGDDPRIVCMLIEKAIEQRNRGRLK